MTYATLIGALLLGAGLQVALLDQAQAAGGTDYVTALSDDSQFKAFGEKPGLVRIMDDFMVNLLANPRTQPFFEKVDKPHVKAELVEQFCEILGGPCVYKGARMGPIHKGLALDTADFNALVEALQAAMDKNDVPFRSQNVLLSKLAPMHRDVITQ